MPKLSRLDLRLEPVVSARLYELELELLGEGIKADRTTIAKALILGTTAPQAHGMVRAFNRQMAAGERGRLYAALKTFEEDS